MRAHDQDGVSSESVIKSFVILLDGTVIKYAEVENKGNKYSFKSGRAIVTALPNGIAFKTLQADATDIVAWGTLLNSETDNRVVEADADCADRLA